MLVPDRKRLEMALSRIPDHPAPRSDLEQVRTPGVIAAKLLWIAHEEGDLEGHAVLDLGCGTGVLAIGAALLGAAHVLAVDVDPAALEGARAAAVDAGVEKRITFLEKDVRSLDVAGVQERLEGPAHTTVMNPPFGADLGSRARGGDRVFLALAFGASEVVYGLHPAKTERFLSAFATDSGFDAARADVVDFPLPGRFAHHRDLVRTLPVGIYRFNKADLGTGPSQRV